MGIDLKLTVDGQERFNQALEFISDQIKDFRPAFDKAEQLFYRIEERQFNTQGARANAWTQLSPAYRKWKDKHHPGKKILELSGALRRSLTGRGAGGIRILTARELTLGSNLPYALAHQRGRGNMPARPPIDLTERDEKAFVKIFLESMAEIGKNAGFEVPYRDIFDNASESSGVSF